MGKKVKRKTQERRRGRKVMGGGGWKNERELEKGKKKGLQVDRLCFDDEDKEMENEWKECEKREEGSQEGEERRKYEERLEVEKSESAMNRKGEGEV
jgi:hypothetical protein